MSESGPSNPRQQPSQKSGYEKNRMLHTEVKEAVLASILRHYPDRAQNFDPKNIHWSDDEESVKKKDGEFNYVWRYNEGTLNDEEKLAWEKTIGRKGPGASRARTISRFGQANLVTLRDMINRDLIFPAELPAGAAGVGAIARDMLLAGAAPVTSAAPFAGFVPLPESVPFPGAAAPFLGVGDGAPTGFENQTMNTFAEHPSAAAAADFSSASAGINYPDPRRLPLLPSRLLPSFFQQQQYQLLQHSQNWEPMQRSPSPPSPHEGSYEPMEEVAPPIPEELLDPRLQRGQPQPPPPPPPPPPT
ncbi:hypothetical protein TWF694_009621 [Orbilia ellipsospora]|uniref:Uncharacterized protein n=1 Tax=Orbilia ellipsospora TaxID=2528407 RepID=A0AAV9XCJ6_9PEZI